MQDIRPPELTERLREHLESEISSRREAGESKIILSRIDSTALMRLCQCSGKNEASLEGLMASGDKDIVSAAGFIIKDMAGLSEWGAKIRRYAELLAKIERGGKKSVLNLPPKISPSKKPLPPQQLKKHRKFPPSWNRLTRSETNSKARTSASMPARKAMIFSRKKAGKPP